MNRCLKNHNTTFGIVSEIELMQRARGIAAGDAGSSSAKRRSEAIGPGTVMTQN